MKTTRISSSGSGGAGRWQRGKRAWSAPSGIVLLLMILLSVIDVGKTYGQQGVGISENPIVPHSSSILELQSTLRGFLAPRMSTAERVAIATPAQGLLVFDTNTQSFWYYNSGWKAIASTSIGTANQLLGMNNAGDANEYKSLLGTTNRISVTHGLGTITLSAPQDIHTGASPTFNGLTVSGLTPNRGVYTNGSSALTTIAPTSGPLGYWNRTGNILSPFTAGDYVTTSGNIYTTGTGTITSAGLLTAQSGATVSGGALTVNNQAITQLTGGQVTFAGNLDATNGVDITGAPLTVATPADLNSTLDVAGQTDLAAAGVSTNVRGTLNVAQQATFTGNVDANSGVDVTGGALTVTNQSITQTGTNQVSFGGNVDATNGLDVTNADLTVGGGNFSVDDANGNVNTAGNVNITGNLSFDLTNPVNEIVTDAEVDLTAPSDNALVTESALASSIGNQAGSGLTYNTVTKQIDLGGDLTVDADINVKAGTLLTVNDNAGNVTLSADENGALTIGDGTVTVGDGTITTGTGQVTIGGNLNANNGADVTGADLTVGGTNFTVGVATGN
ncbi:MAG: hypothetical protein A2X03_01485, partial [Bacteroidetes bacterium GWA2_40_15]